MKNLDKAFFERIMQIIGADSSERGGTANVTIYGDI